MNPSTLRLYLMRLVFLLNFLWLGFYAWPRLINHTGPWDPVRGVAFSFWAALSTLSLVGIRSPLKMVPLLLLQLVYKSIWLMAVYLPMRGALSTGLTPVMAGGVIVDLLVIPWSYVLAAYVKAPGDGWRRNAGVEAPPRVSESRI